MELELSWYAPSYIRWVSTVLINAQSDEHKQDGKWTTNWARAKPRTD